MYLRHTTVTKNGKSHTYWRLVRSVRHGSKVRQETVAQLGELDAEGRLAAQALADRIVGVERQPGLFDDDLPTEPIPLDLRAGSASNAVGSFGDVWLAAAVLGKPRSASIELLARLLPGRTRRRSLGHHGRGPRDRSALFAVQRAAHRRGLVSPHRTRRPARRGRGEDQRRSLLPGARPFAGSQDRTRNASEGAARFALRSRLRSAALRRDQHLLRRPGRRQPAGSAWLLARSSQ